MKVKPYEKVSTIYNGLMNNLDYNSWSNYLLTIADTYINSNGRILELGAGNCKIANYFSKKYNNYVATDLSHSMLKLSENGHIKKICCDMTELPVKIKFDFIFSAFDSVNYLLKQKELLRLFEAVSGLLTENGVFTFDASLEKNSLNFIISKTTEGRYNGSSYRMISKYNNQSRIHYNKFYIWDESGKKYKETHKEKIYDIAIYFKLAEKAGLQTLACYDCFDFKDFNQKSKRVQFVMRKIS